MNFVHLPFLYCIFLFFSDNQSIQYPPTVSEKIVKTGNQVCLVESKNVVPDFNNIILKSEDGGATWQDISQTLPEYELPQGFFAGESEIYVRIKNQIFSSKNNSGTPIWKKESGLNSKFTSIAFSNSGVLAYNNEGKIYKRMDFTGSWLPVFKTFKNSLVRTVFETSSGNVFIGCENGLYKSSDNGKTWKQVLNQGMMKLVESHGALMGTCQKGIIRSVDGGEKWELVIAEGGVGIAVEHIQKGFAAIAYNAVTMTRRIHLSFDNGKTWKLTGEALQPSMLVSSINQVGNSLVCGHPDGIFLSSDLGTTWNNVYPTVNKKMFGISDNKIFQVYVAGNVLYAVAKNGGC